MAARSGGFAWNMTTGVSRLPGMIPRFGLFAAAQTLTSIVPLSANIVQKSYQGAISDLNRRDFLLIRSFDAQVYGAYQTTGRIPCNFADNGSRLFRAPPSGLP